MNSNSYRENFKHNFVKPLYKPKYKKVKPNNKDAVATHSVIELDGSDLHVNKKIIRDKNEHIDVFSNKTRKDILLHKRLLINNYVNNNSKHDTRKVLLTEKKTISSKDCRMINNLPQSECNTVPHIWLRIYPLPKQPRESLSSLIFRCVFCILGLYSVLIIWTVIWVFIIHSFEGPYEAQVSIEFEENQNQLVIDLATELRLITPLSPKWKDTIIKRIEDERQLTTVALAQGAKLHPGEFWDLSGTFLFTIYVMTALGFGAPVPHTLWGRTSALLYALLAVPIHLYLMLNISTCVIENVDACTNNLKIKLSERKSLAHRKSALEMMSQNPNCSRGSEILQAKYSSCFRRMITRILNIFCACRCMPLITVFYYVCGALAFGWSRNKQPLEVAMFPLEFTTSGGLELVTGYVRILYALYLESAIILLACLLSTVKRNCSSAVSKMADKCRLFTSIHEK